MQWTCYFSDMTSEPQICSDLIKIFFCILFKNSLEITLDALVDYSVFIASWGLALMCTEPLIFKLPCHSIFHCAVGECEVAALVQGKRVNLCVNATPPPATYVVLRSLHLPSKWSLLGAGQFGISVKYSQPSSIYKVQFICGCQKYLGRALYIP